MILEEALAIDVKAYGKQHRETAAVLNSLGQIHRFMGDLVMSQQLLLEALQIRRLLFGDLDLSVGASLNNLAELHREMRDYQVGCDEWSTCMHGRQLHACMEDDDHYITISLTHYITHSLYITHNRKPSSTTTYPSRPSRVREGETTRAPSTRRATWASLCGAMRG